MNIHQFQQLVNRYLKSKSGPHEKKAIDKWFGQNSGMSGYNQDQLDLIGEEIHHKILHEIDQRSGNKLRRIRTTKYVLRIAASVILICSIAFILRNSNRGLSPKPEFITFQTPKGRKAKIFLSDGSIVWVNAGSRIRYLKEFRQNAREIYLDKGEAFFQVKHDQTKSFIVHAGILNTQVLGTSFNIHLNPVSHKTTVTVRTGKVSVFTRTLDQASRVTTLLPNQKAVYEPSTNLITAQQADAYSSASWRENVLVLRNDDLNEMKEKLENWYGVKISYKNAIDIHCLITARFGNQTLLSVLETIKKVNGYDFKISGDQVVIVNKPCN